MKQCVKVLHENRKMYNLQLKEEKNYQIASCNQMDATLGMQVKLKLLGPYILTKIKGNVGILFRFYLQEMI